MKHLLQKGQTLIGVLIALALLVILAQALFTLTNTSYRLVGFNRSRIAARHIAQERIELIRNLPYDDIGTVGGIPSGILEQTETIVRNGLSYTLTTSIVYIDDSFDDLAPDDLLPIDYKRARVAVSWDGVSPSRNSPVVLVTDIAPQGIETTDGGGTLSILVFDANALPVAQADVRIQAGALTPSVDLELQTNDNGRIILPGTPECTECYTITVTKAGYSTDKTYSTAEVANPAKPLQSIIEGAVTEVSFAIDQTSSLTINSFNNRESGFSVAPSIAFTLQGTKSIGTDIDDFPVYKYSESFTTNETGSITVEDLEWDNYEIIIPAASGTTLSGSNPVTPLSLLPDTIQTLLFSFDTLSAHTYLGVFTDGTNPVASVSATLTSSTFNQTLFTGGATDPDFGQIFLNDLGNEVHTLTATASGYLDYTGTVNMSGNKKETTILTPQ